MSSAAKTSVEATKTAVTLGVIVASRGFFNPAHARTAREQVTAELEALGIGYEILPADATPNGAVETREDTRKYAEFFRERRDRIHGLLVVLANFGDEIAVADTIRYSGLNVPVLLQAGNDRSDRVDIGGRKDAYCGKISVANNLYQYGIPWTDTTYHTCDVNSDTFRDDLRRFAGVCRVVRTVRGARIGMIGARPAPFRTVRFSEKLLQNNDITVVPVDMSEILSVANGFSGTDDRVAQKVDAIRGYGNVPAQIPNEQVQRQACLSLAIEDWISENEIDASAIQCWPSVQTNYGCATCVTMSMMGEQLRPSACEVDITGAISMLALAVAAEQPSALLDWNNNYDDKLDTVVATHCSNYPKRFVGGDIEISQLDVLGESLGRDNSFGAIKGKVAPGGMTYFRMSTDDRHGLIKAYVGEGEFTDDPFPMHGGIAVCRIPRERELMRFITQQGFEHHVAMVRGSVADILEEASATYLGWSTHRHE